MKLFKFFVSKIFLRRIIPGISIILLICLSNYTTFIATRTVFSTYQGYQETSKLNQDGIYIANLDPNSPVDFGTIDADKTKAVYDYLSSNFDYAFYVDGLMVSIPNRDDMEISLCYMNEAYYQLKGSVKNFVALVKNSSFLVRIIDMTILIEKEFIYGSGKRPNPTDYYRKQHYQCG